MSTSVYLQRFNNLDITFELVLLSLGKWLYNVGVLLTVILWVTGLCGSGWFPWQWWCLHGASVRGRARTQDHRQTRCLHGASALQPGSHTRHVHPRPETNWDTVLGTRRVGSGRQKGGGRGQCWQPLLNPYTANSEHNHCCSLWRFATKQTKLVLTPCLW